MKKALFVTPSNQPFHAPSQPLSKATCLVLWQKFPLDLPPINSIDSGKTAYPQMSALILQVLREIFLLSNSRPINLYINLYITIVKLIFFLLFNTLLTFSDNISKFYNIWSSTLATQHGSILKEIFICSRRKYFLQRKYKLYFPQKLINNSIDV